MSEHLGKTKLYVFGKVGGPLSSGSHNLYWTKEPRQRFHWPFRLNPGCGGGWPAGPWSSVPELSGAGCRALSSNGCYVQSQIPALHRGGSVAQLAKLEGCSCSSSPQPSPPLPAWLSSSACSLPVSSSEDYFFLGRRKRKGERKKKAPSSLLQV